MPTPPFPSPRFSRRTLIGSSLAGAALLPVGTLHAQYQETASSPAASPAASPVGSPAASPVASSAGGRTWVLASADELRPAAPGAPTQAEIDEVVAAQAAPSDATTAAITRWGTGPAVVPWASLAVDVSAEFMIGGMPQTRFMGIYHPARHDAVIAAGAARVAHARPSP